MKTTEFSLIERFTQYLRRAGGCLCFITGSGYKLGTHGEDIGGTAKAAFAGDADAQGKRK